VYINTGSGRRPYTMIVLVLPRFDHHPADGGRRPDGGRAVTDHWSSQGHWPAEANRAAQTSLQSLLWQTHLPIVLGIVVPCSIGLGLRAVARCPTGRAVGHRDWATIGVYCVPGCAGPVFAVMGHPPGLRRNAARPRVLRCELRHVPRSSPVVLVVRHGGCRAGA